MPDDTTTEDEVDPTAFETETELAERRAKAEAEEAEKAEAKAKKAEDKKAEDKKAEAKKK